MLRYLLEKEFKQIRRDRFMPKIIFIIPIMQLIILPFRYSCNRLMTSSPSLLNVR